MRTCGRKRYFCSCDRQFFCNDAGGKISGTIYAGGLSKNDGTANVGGTATVTFLADIGFEGTVDGSNAKSSVLAFGDGSTVFNANFSGTFKNFDELRPLKALE